MSSSSEPIRLSTDVRTSTVEERRARGVDARKRWSRTSLGQYEPSAERPDPVELLLGQEGSRVPVLVPIRHARMAVSPFTFYRGSAIVMAADLGERPNSGLVTQLCGDAHLANFGMFAAPDRGVVFDINDFDETHPGPFEWDVLRLATSFVLAGREIGLGEAVIRDAARSAGSAYRLQMATYANATDLDVWYDRIDVSEIKVWAKQEGYDRASKQVDKRVAKARTRDSWSAAAKLTHVVDGRREFLDQPPLLVRFPLDGEAGIQLHEHLTEYRGTLLRDRALLIDRYHAVDMAHKVVGVGSVGLLAFVILLQGRDSDDLLVLQAKQAVRSVLEPYAGASALPSMGERVVTGQRIMQAASDAFLGWLSTGLGHDYYVRQLRDMKYAPDPTGFNEHTLGGYARLCGRALARAHARAGDSVALSGYLGSGTKFDEAVRDFALSYSEQVTRDFASFQAAIAEGRVEVADESKSAGYSVVTDPDRGVELVPGTAADSSRPASS